MASCISSWTNQTSPFVQRWPRPRASAPPRQLRSPDQLGFTGVELQRIVIVGASLAGVRTAEALRTKGFDGELILVGSEDLLPYDRPPLSKSYLEGKRTADQLSLRPTDPTLASLGVTLRLGTSAIGLDIDNRQVGLSGGDRIGFDGLVIATGTAPRVLPGTAHLRRVHTVRTLGDADALRPSLIPGAKIVVIGAGFIGGEVASTAKAAGAEVTVLEAMPVPLSRQLGDQMGSAVASLHERNGVSLRSDCAVSRLSDTHVHLGSGEMLQYDACVVGVGVRPNTEWLTGTGLDTSNGVFCDTAMRALVAGSPDPRIVAVGDIARWVNPRYAYEGPVRVEHWTNAVESADHAAATLLAGDSEPEPFSPVPYFWSDQYGSKIQFLGRSAGFDEVTIVNGSTDGKFVALYRRGDRLVAALGVSSVKAVMGYRQRLLDGCSWRDALAAATS